MLVNIKYILVLLILYAICPVFLPHSSKISQMRFYTFCFCSVSLIVSFPIILISSLSSLCILRTS
nr:MAG TPA: hypothetical protein [Bacteriophage sp.]